MNRITYLLFLTFFSLKSFSQSTASENVSSFEIKAEKLGTLKRIWVYLPKNYKSSEKSYPVIYMHDAQNLFDKETSYVGEWKVDESLDNNKEPEAIIVGIEHGGDKRIDELTPFPHEKYGGGKADAYLDFIMNNLKPQIDRTYRTLPDYKNTGIFGSSLGGLISLYAGLKCPDTFGMIGVYSPSLWFNDEIFEFAAQKKLNSATKIYFLAGTDESDEMVPDLKNMIKVLTENGLTPENFKVNYVEGGKHSEEMWSQHFLETYLWLMEK